MRIPRLSDIQKVDADIRYARLQDMPDSPRVDAQPPGDAGSGVYIDTQSTDATYSVVVTTDSLTDTTPIVVTVGSPAVTTPIAVSAQQEALAEPVRGEASQPTSVQSIVLRADGASETGVAKVETSEAHTVSRLHAESTGTAAIGSAIDISGQQEVSQPATPQRLEPEELYRASTIQDLSRAQVSAVEHVREISGVAGDRNDLLDYIVQQIADIKGEIDELKRHTRELDDALYEVATSLEHFAVYGV